MAFTYKSGPVTKRQKLEVLVEGWTKISKDIEQMRQEHAELGISVPHLKGHIDGATHHIQQIINPLLTSQEIQIKVD